VKVADAELPQRGVPAPVERDPLTMVPQRRTCPSEGEMAARVKNWKKFQHFKDRSPPWIKLYRDLLDDPDWHELSGDEAKALVMIWLVASENDG
jgi:hypothetical protein